MRNRELHDALRDFALESAALLTSAVNAGAELPYDVLEEPGTGSVLYRYQPLTAEFIGARWDSLRAQPSFARAASALGTGAEAYLRLRGLPGGADSEPALRALLERLYEDASGFEFPEERFDRVYSEFERTLYEHTMRASVVATVHGLVLERERVELGSGLILARGDRVPAPPEAAWPLGPGERERATGPNTVCVIERDVEADGGLPIAEARIRFRTLLTAMRLLKPGRVALGAPAWGRADEGAWQPIALPFSGRGRGAPWLLTAAEGAELAELVELVATMRLPGRIGWALSRFELGCERASEAEAISDYLLALRGMLDAEDEAGRASLGLRLAALCAEETERRAVRARLESAFAIEREAMGGAVFDPDDAEGPALVREIEQHVRALLRDVVCGYLAGDLRSVADDILLASSDPIEIRARDTRPEPPDLADAPPPFADEREPGLPEPLATGEHDPGSAEPLATGEHEPGLFERTDWGPEPGEAEPAPGASDPDPDRGRVVRRSRPLDGPGTAADPLSAAWRVATRTGPRRKREDVQATAPATATAVAEQATIADAPLPVEDLTVADAPLPDPLAPAAPEPLVEEPAEPLPAEPDEPTSRIAALDAPEPEGLEQGFAAGVTPSADWGDDEDCWSAPV